MLIFFLPLAVKNASQGPSCTFLVMIGPILESSSIQIDCSNRLSFPNVVIFSQYHMIVMVMPSARSVFKVLFCSECGGSIFIWSTGTYLPVCTLWHSLRPYLNIHCSGNIKSHIVISVLNNADFTIKFYSSFAVSTVTYADILLQ